MSCTSLGMSTAREGSPRLSRRVGTSKSVKDRVEVFPLEQSVAVHGVSMSGNFPLVVPFAECIGGHPEAIGSLRDAHEFSQIFHIQPPW